MTTARPIPTKVSRLIPMLGSPADHEALSAARAIGRVLDREGLGFTDLAAAIPTANCSDAGTIVPPAGQSDPCAGARFSRRRENCRRRQDFGAGAQSEFSRRREKATASGWIHPFDTYAWKRAYTPRQEAEHRSRVRFCQSRPWSFSPRERAFLDGIGRLHGNLTIRQGDWLAALADRLDQELRCA